MQAMTTTPGRVVYAGLLGQPSSRQIGAMSIYFAPDAPFEIRVGSSRFEHACVAAVLPNMKHDIRSTCRFIGVLLIEPETTSLNEMTRLSQLMVANGCAIHERIRQAFETWLRSDSAPLDTMAIDEHFFGAPLEQRQLDPRIAHWVEQIVDRPSHHFSATECARLSGLSFNRFVHLFTQEAGLPFRTFCAWKRARSLLHDVQRDSTLTDLALANGYPDSTHFSHSIRRVYGLRPIDILSGSRRLVLQSLRPPQVVDHYA